MHVLMFDIDTLRPDHLGCYGYGRDTSPNIDAIAREGVVFDEYYTPNAPCLPSRASLITGQYGIHTGVVGHGGTAGDMRLEGEDRDFTDSRSGNGLFMQFRKKGYHTVSFSSFAERHSSYWFTAGFHEVYNFGRCGGEDASVISPVVTDWIERNGDRENWFLHVNLWDPHTPYRTPAEFGNPWENEPLPDDWITDEVFREHYLHVGPHGAREINMWDDWSNPATPRHPGSLNSKEDAKRFIDNYDCGIRFADQHIGIILNKLREKGLYNDDLAIIVTSDHGENLGELGLYAEHGTADHITGRIPMIIRWKGCKQGIREGTFHDNTDLLPTVRDLLGIEGEAPIEYDGKSFAKALTDGVPCGRDSVILTQCAHVCQRSARFGDWLYLRTVHGGYHLFPKEMLFNVKEDYHMLRNLAEERPELCAYGAKLILDWVDSMMKNSESDADPMWTVLREGGPLHCRYQLDSYIERLRGTDREYGVEALKKMYPNEKKRRPR